MIKISIKTNGRTYTDVKQGVNAFKETVVKKANQKLEEFKKEAIKKAKKGK